MNPTLNTTPITKDEWVKKYWFNTLQMVEVLNPTWYLAPGTTTPVTKDYIFMVEMRHYMIKAGGRERFPGVIANVYLDGMSKLLAQNEDNLGMMADPNLKKLYYDRLIVDVDSLVSEHNEGPAWLKNVPESAKVEAQEEVAPWDNNMERARDVPPAPAPSPEPIVEEVPEQKAKSEDKEFELEGIRYRLVVGKDGREMYYKGNKLTNSAEYHRAASLL